MSSGIEDFAVDVCICTFRRPHIKATLASVARQTYTRGPVRVIVADNDEDDSARPSIVAEAEALGLTLRYVHAPAANISIARNACVDAVTAPRFAFIDDDECAAPDWLQNLVNAMEATGADAVFGPVDAVYPDGAPAWWSAAGLHDTRPTILRGGVIATGYTCNVLIRTASLEGVRFRIEFGTSGGEDTMLFHELFRRGRRYVFAPDALVREGVPSRRMRLRWLLARSFLGGQIHTALVMFDKTPLPPVAALSFLKMLYSAMLVPLSIASPGKWRRTLMRASLHAGVIARMFGVAQLRRK